MEHIEKLKQYRIAADLSWGELAGMIGVHVAYLQHIAHGRVLKVGPRTEYKLNRFYNEHRSEIEAVIGHTQETT